MITSYPKIFTLGTDYIKDIFDGEVEVTEKIDGSQFAFGNVNGTLYTRSKGAIIFPEASPKMFKKMVDYVQYLHQNGKLPNNTVFYGEILDKPKHNALKYDRVPKNNIALFGALMYPQQSMFNYESLVEFARQFDIDVVPMIAYGIVHEIGALKNLLERESYLGGSKIEGVVVKNYNKPFLLGGQPIPIMAGKLVSESFKEVNHKSWDAQKGSNKLHEFIDSFRTEARWQKAVQHLAEKNELSNAPQDIGKLMKEVSLDIIAEEKEAIAKWLYNHFRSDITRNAVRGLPEWYKMKLAERSFTDESGV